MYASIYLYIFLLYLCVGHPAAGLDLVAVQAPVLQLLLEQWPAHVRRVVQLTSST